MNFNFDLHDLFPSDLVKIGEDMIPQCAKIQQNGSSNLTSLSKINPEDSTQRASCGSRLTKGLIQARVSQIIDSMGEASAMAQGLRQAITTGSKVRSHPEYVVYLLLDFESNGGFGSVVGLLKAGRKNLFLLDRLGEQNEVYPTCVLDFYVHESRQRSGCGKILFQLMLRDQSVSHPKFMAVDRPSPKLLGFLRKYYGLESPIPQVNNYVIYEGFFSNNNIETNKSPATVKRPKIIMGKLTYV